MMSIIETLLSAINAHDLERLVACFAEDYSLTAPLHPARSFQGTEQVRRNWTQIFAAVPDVSARILRSASDGDTVWTEWEMSGTRRDGKRHDMRGVFIFGVGGSQIRWGRMFLEPVADDSQNMDAAVRAQTS